MQQPPKIVVIEDHKDLQDNLQELFELHGYVVFTASTGEEGIELVREHSPHVVLCDIVLPGIDGYHVYSSLATGEHLSKTAFLFLSSRTHLHEIRKGMNLGADDYLTKPINENELLAAVNARLHRFTQLRNGHIH